MGLKRQLRKSRLEELYNHTCDRQLREESEELLKQLRVRLEAERMEECDRLEAQKNQELQRLQNLSELELQAAKERLEELRESVQKQMEREEQTLRSDTLSAFLILNRWFRTFSGKSPSIFPSVL